MPDLHVIVGAGPVGRATAIQLAGEGHEVLLVSRSGSGPAVPGVRREAVDAADADRLTELTTGATALYNCVNPPSYTVWPTFWPPVAAAFLTAAQRTGATLVTASCLYAYGPVDEPMVEGMPDAATTKKARIRARMWAEARAAHEAGRIAAVEVRGSDYMGPWVAPASGQVARVTAAALAGRTVRVMGRPDRPHSFTDVRDMGRALAAVAQAPRTWGRVWHAPTNAPRTQAEAVADVCRAAGREPVAVKPFPRWVLGVGGAVVPVLRELRETEYQFTRPYVLDSSAIARELGLEPTPWAEVCRASALGQPSTLTPCESD
ncbi:NAD-dependent epimerase/dehydratase family protein [Nocardioides sp. YIM 152315]|uniref:NAD-dependent epimerase/dehydratase family protein n=1 Tax=Nocardioides sp. YIM 152315 TaxID=3031760 RepID=UPI0023D991DC|nr:NAD-dependent epimerase/dehydratase family protein [Nocardioides sp. YIM 152315]MDF1603152.1 NAD-dependent epimerase/dehydratase family protein [Nocardioides sp. YIM 152315]